MKDVWENVKEINNILVVVEMNMGFLNVCRFY